MKLSGLQTISIFRLLKNFPLSVGDKFVYCGKDLDAAAQSARILVRDRHKIDYKIEQKKIIVIDPETGETVTGRIVEIKDIKNV
jgi:hypothetical protein